MLANWMGVLRLCESLRALWVSSTLYNSIIPEAHLLERHRMSGIPSIMSGKKIIIKNGIEPIWFCGRESPVSPKKLLSQFME